MAKICKKIIYSKILGEIYNNICIEKKWQYCHFFSIQIYHITKKGVLFVFANMIMTAEFLLKSVDSYGKRR